MATQSDPDTRIQGWGENLRGVSYVFGSDVIHRFQKAFDVDLIVRAHQVVEDGYKFDADRALVTIFSAPNYCGQFDNDGAILTIDENFLCSFHIVPSAAKVGL